MERADGEAEYEDHLIEMLEDLKEREEIDRSEFWSIVKDVKRDPSLTQGLANLIGEVDDMLFRRSSLLKIPMLLGNLFELSLALLAVALMVGAFYPGAVPDLGVPTPVARGGIFVVAQLVLATAVHPLAHQLIGRANGISFSFYFLNGPAKIEPTIKTDYATYLKTPPRGRARMHVAGAFATNLATLLVLIVGVLAEVPIWSLAVMAALFLFGFLNEFAPAVLARFGRADLLDMKKTDTYRYLREKRYAE